MNTALECATLSEMIYAPLFTFKHRLQVKYPGCPIQVFQQGGCECACICVAHKKTTIIVFRGTEFSTPNDFLANLDIFREQDQHLGKKVYVHSGFLQELKEVWQSIYQFINTHARQTYHNLIITGHSLGGAIALLCAARLSLCFLCHVHCYSFGSPMVGGNTFYNFYENSLNLTHYRFENQNDIVPKLKTLSYLGYEHVGQRYYFNYLGDMISRKLTWKESWKDWIMGQWQALKRMQLFDSLKDHRINQYVQILDRNLT